MTNSFDQDHAAAVIDEIEREESLIKSSQAKHMKYARERRDRIKEIKKSAKDDGLPEDVVNSLLKVRKANAVIKETQEALSTDYKPIFKPLAEALGGFIDLPLGMAAKAAEVEQAEMFPDASEDLEDAAAEAAAREEAEQAEGAEILKH